VQLRRRGWGETMRRDAWWVQPVVVFVILSSFLAYATWAAFQNAHFEYGNYLSPFYSPLLFGDSPTAWFGPKPAWWPGLVPFSPALIILPFPAGFRFTCYYYRGAYYKAFWSDPPSCAVGEPRKGYRGEKSFPLIIQNVHRYFMYFALVFLFFLAHDAWKAMWFTDATGNSHFGIGVGTIVLTANVILLGGYTLGCHSFRHLIGGYLDRLSGAPIRKKAYDCASCLNRGHMRWAWFSLFGVAFSDIYVRMLSMGIWTDFRFF
ncbi:MAG: succinate dehydrogenase, partial [Gemmatimonadales bacterium]